MLYEMASRAASGGDVSPPGSPNGSVPTSPVLNSPSAVDTPANPNKPTGATPYGRGVSRKSVDGMTAQAQSMATNPSLARAETAESIYLPPPKGVRPPGAASIELTACMHVKHPPFDYFVSVGWAREVSLFTNRGYHRPETMAMFTSKRAELFDSAAPAAM